VESSVSTGLPAPGGGVRFVNGLSSVWTGTADASASTLSQDGAVVATNSFAAPNATMQYEMLNGTSAKVGGKWEYRSIAADVSAIYSILPSDLPVGTVVYYKISADTRIRTTLQNASLLKQNDDGERWWVIDTVGDHAIFIVGSDSGGSGVGQTVTLERFAQYTSSDYATLQSLGIDWFTGDTYQGSGFRFPVDFGSAGVDGRARFTNEGTAPASVRFMVSGSLPDGFSLRCVETGDVLTFRRPVASDDYVLLDSSDGSALLNGVSPVSGYLTDDDWWQVGPGETCTVQFTSLGGVQGSPLLVLSGSPAYF
jgi:hypothetical protein